MDYRFLSANSFSQLSVTDSSYAEFFSFEKFAEHVKVLKDQKMVGGESKQHFILPSQLCHIRQRFDNLTVLSQHRWYPIRIFLCGISIIVLIFQFVDHLLSTFSIIPLFPACFR